MAPERHSPTDPREWLNRARSSLAKAHVRADDIYLGDLCFDASRQPRKRSRRCSSGGEYPFRTCTISVVCLISRRAQARKRLLRCASQFA